VFRENEDLQGIGFVVEPERAVKVGDELGFLVFFDLDNCRDPDPPDWRTALLATHPPTIERIGIAVAYQRGARASGGR